MLKHGVVKIMQHLKVTFLYSLMSKGAWLFLDLFLETNVLPACHDIQLTRMYFGTRIVGQDFIELRQ